MKQVLKRMSEPSTWAGLSALMGIAFGVSDAEWMQITTAITAIATAVLAIVFKEGIDGR